MHRNIGVMMLLETLLARVKVFVTSEVETNFFFCLTIMVVAATPEDETGQLGKLRNSLDVDHYLDEFTLRFNRRRSSACGLLFHRLAQQVVSVDPVPYSSIIYSTSALRG